MFQTLTPEDAHELVILGMEVWESGREKHHHEWKRSTLRKLPGKERTDCNACNLDVALGHSGLSCVGQEIKLHLNQGQDFRHAI